MHIAGERLFVDFAGHTMEVIDAATGEIQRAEVFVAVLGASSFIYAEATASQALPDWIAAHVNALTALGGVPRQIVSDNLKAGITKMSTRHKNVQQFSMRLSCDRDRCPCGWSESQMSRCAGFVI